MKLAVASVLLAMVLAIDGRKNWKKANVKQMPLLQPFSSELIRYTLKTTWRTEGSYLDRAPFHQVKRMYEVLSDRKGLQESPVMLHSKKNYKDIPEEFDARTQWPDCSTIDQIYDEGCCSSAWAIAPVSTMSDRTCIHSGDDVTLSVQDLLTCCNSCDKFTPNGCDGARRTDENVWNYWVWNGLVSEDCKPYNSGNCPWQPAPACDKTCEKSFNGTYQDDKHFGTKSYKVSSEPAQIQTEIMTNGPVQASFLVFADFLSIESGVYQHKSGEWLFFHSVKILGWGVESGTPYWLAANSWSSDWGDKGFFKILRGSNECYIESFVFAGLP